VGSSVKGLTKVQVDNSENCLRFCTQLVESRKKISSFHNLLNLLQLFCEIATNMNVFTNCVLFFCMISPDPFSSIRQSFIQYFSHIMSSAEKWPKIISFCKIQILMKPVYIPLFISVWPKFHLLSFLCQILSFLSFSATSTTVLFVYYSGVQFLDFFFFLVCSFHWL